MSEEKTLELYPSNWLYNAGVIGFLRVLEKTKKIEVSEFVNGKINVETKKILRKNNEIFPEVLKYLMDYYFPKDKLEEWKKKKYKGKVYKEKYKKEAEDIINQSGKDLDEGYKYLALWGKLFASKTPFQNLIQKEEWKSLKNFDLLENAVNSNGQKCELCGEKRVHFSECPSNLEIRIQKFQYAHFKGLGSSPKKFPNSFWNMESSLRICPICLWLILHYPLAFTRTSDGSEIFVNAPDFKLMWYLNRFVREIYEKGEAKDVRKLFGLSLMQWAIRINQTLGAWTMANIEVVRKRGDIIDHLDLPADVVGILMDSTVAWILTSLGQWKLLELVMRERWSEILIATYCAARASLADEIREGHCIKKYVIPKSQKEKEKEKEIKEKSDEMFWKLPLLFARIKDLTMEDKMKEKNKASIVNSLKKEGEKVKDLRETFKNLAFRILELTRLGKINDAYQAIIRVFIASKKPIPTKLVDILGEEDIELQKSYIYAFLSGVLGNGKEGGEA